MNDARRLSEAAQEILSQRKYHVRRTPAPFRGLLRSLGRLLEPLADAVARFFRPVTSLVERIWGAPVGRIAIAVALLGVVALLARVAATRRMVRSINDGSGPGRAHTEDPAALDRAAAEAEGRGALALALRLRFRAGLVRLERAGRITAADRRTTAALAAEAHSAPLAELGRRFDAVVYGHAEASSTDIERARQTFAALLEEQRA